MVFALLLAATCLGLAAPASAEEGTDASGPVLWTDIKATINPGVTGQISHGIREAERRGAAVLVLRLNTPGGLLSSTRDIVSAISASKVPVVGLVAPSGASATSAGAFILLSTHVAVMVGGTNVGAASPVGGGGEEVGETMAAKVMNDTRAFMRSVAESRGRNVDEAELLVSESVSRTAGEALALGLINLEIAGEDALMAALDGRMVAMPGGDVRLDTAGKVLELVPPRLVDEVLTVLAHPQIAYLLTSLGSLAIYVEIMNPGLMIAGIPGAISLILGLICLQVLPTSTGFLLLMFLGIGLMTAELFVAGFGILGIGGAVAFILGSLNLFSEPALPGLSDMIVTTSIAVGAAMLILGFALGRFGRNVGSRRAGAKVGTALADFSGRGHVRVGEEIWQAVSREPVKRGETLRIKRQVDQMTVEVEKI